MEGQSIFKTTLMVFFVVYRMTMWTFAGMSTLFGHVVFAGIFAGLATAARLSARFVRQLLDQQPTT